MERASCSSDSSSMDSSFDQSLSITSDQTSPYVASSMDSSFDDQSLSSTSDQISPLVTPSRDYSSSDQSLSITSDQASPFVTPYMLSRTSSSSSSAIGDYIGTESCFDVLSADEENHVVSCVSESVKSRFRYGGRRREEREARAAAARKFPPPIPLLAQTENLLPHMPWVLKRVVTSDGRLILREEKVRHHEYFRAHRSNGRLTLHLIPLDDDAFELPQELSDNDDNNDDEHGCDSDDHQEVGDDDDHHHQEVEDNLDVLADTINKGVIITSAPDDDKDTGNVHGDSEDGYRNVKLAALAANEPVLESGVMVGGGGSPRGKCLKSCFVGMRVREIRVGPVLS